MLRHPGGAPRSASWCCASRPRTAFSWSSPRPTGATCRRRRRRRGMASCSGSRGQSQNVYATLIVRLTRSNRFTRVDTWQSAARFAAETGSAPSSSASTARARPSCGSGTTGYPTLLRKQFERFVHAHLDRRATPGTVTRERRYSCPRDGTAFTSEQVEQVIGLGRLDILCPVCENTGLAARRLRAGQRHRSVHRGDGRLGGRRPGDRGRLGGGAGKGGGRGVRRLPLPQLGGQARRPRARAAAAGTRAAPVAGRARAAPRDFPGSRRSRTSSRASRPRR